jgi:hypothetical protein
MPYPSENKLEEDRIYFLKKMGWSTKDLKDYLNRPEIPHDSYGSERKLYEGLTGIYKRFTENNGNNFG